MIKKILIVFLFIFTVSELSFAGFGFDIRLGRVMRENNNFDSYLMNSGISTPTITTDRLNWYKGYDRSDFLNYGIDLFCEYPISKTAQIGLKAGYTGFIDVEAQSIYYLGYYAYESGSSGDTILRPSVLSNTQIKSRAYEIPIAIYYKERVNRVISFFTGAGISFLTNEWTVSYYENTNNIPYTESNPKTASDIDDPSKIQTFNESVSSSKAIPLFILGAEARMNKRFAFVFDIRFRYGGKTKYTTRDNFELEHDFSGIGANVSFRYYILP
jgi:hypothetical protein